MDTPIADFARGYASSGKARLHMPGHKGRVFLGPEPLDITEIPGADSLYEVSGIIERSERNASALFGTGGTLYSAEGSSQCIRAMLYLAISMRPAGAARVILAARNVHKAYVYAAALIDFDTVWLWPEDVSDSLCACSISAAGVESAILSLPAPPAAVYITSPDYLGGMADIPAIADICHRHGVPLIVDNAHGAYLNFLPESMHPIAQGADICCDSAHKTLPVLTGGAYLHISRSALRAFSDNARAAMALFGSTSPSYLILSSLDLCNRYIAEGYPARLGDAIGKIASVKAELSDNGWCVRPSDPLRITIAAPEGLTGDMLAASLRVSGVECEYSDGEHIVFMLTPENSDADYSRLLFALGRTDLPPAARQPLPLSGADAALSVREAFFAPHEIIPAADSFGRICGAPMLSCPPAIPIAITGERICREALSLFARYGIGEVDVLK